MTLAAKNSVQLVIAKSLTPWPHNPRSITEDRFDALCRALSADPQMMRARPLIALAGVGYAKDGTTVAGNMRLRAALRLIDEKDPGFLTEFPSGRIPTFVTDLDEDRAKLWALRDNNEYGEWEDQALAEILHGLNDSGADLDLSGFSSESVQLILEGVGPKPLPPQFRSFDDDIETEYECPGCGYDWSGSPRPGATSPLSKRTEAEVRLFARFLASQDEGEDEDSMETAANAWLEQRLEELQAEPVKARGE